MKNRLMHVLICLLVMAVSSRAGGRGVMGVTNRCSALDRTTHSTTIIIPLGAGDGPQRQLLRVQDLGRLVVLPRVGILRSHNILLFAQSYAEATGKATRFQCPRALQGGAVLTAPGLS